MCIRDRAVVGRIVDAPDDERFQRINAESRTFRETGLEEGRALLAQVEALTGVTVRSFEGVDADLTEKVRGETAYRREVQRLEADVRVPRGPVLGHARLRERVQVDVAHEGLLPRGDDERVAAEAAAGPRRPPAGPAANLTNLSWVRGRLPARARTESQFEHRQSTAADRVCMPSCCGFR